jgi:hypothetical protein
MINLQDGRCDSIIIFSLINTTNLPTLQDFFSDFHDQANQPIKYVTGVVVVSSTLKKAMSLLPEVVYSYFN